MRTVLFINGRKNQIERLEQHSAAMRLELNVVNIADEWPTFLNQIVSDHRVIDTSDIDLSIRTAIELNEIYNFVGVVSWSEKDTILRAKIAMALGLPGMDPNDALACRNKVGMRTRLEAVGHVNPKFSAVYDRVTLLRASKYVGFPSVLKPAAGSASRGIFIVNNKEELEQSFSKLQNIISKEYDSVFSGFEGQMILEEMLDGPEISVEGFVHNQEISIVGITDKWVSSQYKIEVCHVHPSKINGTKKEEIYDYSRKIVAALGIDNAPFHLEAKLTSKGFKVVECAARPAGDCITTNVLPLTLLGPHVENCIRSYIGEAPIKIGTPKYYASSKFVFADKSGIFIGVENLDKVLSIPYVVGLQVHLKTGDTVSIPPNEFLNHRVITCLLRANTWQEIFDASNKIDELININII